MFYGIAVTINPIGNDTYANVTNFIESLLGDDVRWTGGGTSSADPDFYAYFDSLHEMNAAYRKVSSALPAVRKVCAQKLTSSGAMGVSDA